MSLLRQWQLLSLLVPTFVVLRPVERVVAWNLGHIDDALAIILAHLHYGSALAAELLMFHSGVPPARRPVEWSRTELMGVPKRPWLEPVPGRHSRWTPTREILESVVLSTPPGSVDLLIHGGHTFPLGEAGAVRQGGHLLLLQPPPGALPAGDWVSAEPTGHVYRKLTPAAVHEEALPPLDTAELSLARHHDRAVLVDSYTNLARSLARRFAHRGERIEDLEQVALLALIQAAGRYEPDCGRAFGAFATVCITGELKRHFRDKIWAVRVPRSVQETHLAIRSARDELSQANGRSPTITQIADHLRTTEEAVLSTMEAVNNSWAISLDVPAPDQTGPATEIAVAEPGFEHSLDRRILKEAIAGLSPTERLILKRVFFDCRTQREVAQELHVSQMQISRLMTKTLAKMKQSFQPA